MSGFMASAKTVFATLVVIGIEHSQKTLSSPAVPIVYILYSVWLAIYIKLSIKSGSKLSAYSRLKYSP